MSSARVMLATGLVLGVLGAGVKPLLAQQDPPPPEPRLKKYHPDETTCQGALIRSSFAKNLLPWADQPEPVLASLRQVQAEMTRATLASCVRQNLMTPAQAAAPSHGHLNFHAHRLTGESLQNATPSGLESEGAEADLQAVGVFEDSWQDGEVGHRCHGHWGRP